MYTLAGHLANVYISQLMYTLADFVHQLRHIHIQIWVENICHSDFVISIYIDMFKIARNYPKKYYLCQKPAKSGSARIWKCVLTLPSSEYLCNQGPNGFQNCGKLLVKKEPARGHCCPMLNVTANSKVKLHILGKAKWLTIFLNHLSIQ